VIANRYLTGSCILEFIYLAMVWKVLESRAKLFTGRDQGIMENNASYEWSCKWVLRFESVEILMLVSKFYSSFPPLVLFY